MPSARRGTVTDDIGGYLKTIKGTNEWKADKEGIVRAPIATVCVPMLIASINPAQLKFSDNEVETNVRHFVNTIIKATTKKGDNQGEYVSAFERMLKKQKNKNVKRGKCDFQISRHVLMHY